MRVSRRAFLASSAVAGLGVAAPSSFGVAHEEAAGSGDAIPFDGPHQAGVITPGDDEATFAALDAIALDMPVQLTWIEEDGITWPAFEPAGAS